MSDSLNPQDYLARFTKRPENTAYVTQVTCIHPVFGTTIYYLALEDYHEHFHGVTRLCWMNSSTMILTPMDGSN